MPQRIYLKEARTTDAGVQYPAAGFYKDVPDELVAKWRAEKVAQLATDSNVVIPEPEEEKPEPAAEGDVPAALEDK